MKAVASTAWGNLKDWWSGRSAPSLSAALRAWSSSTTAIRRSLVRTIHLDSKLTLGENIA